MREERASTVVLQMKEKSLCRVYLWQSVALEIASDMPLFTFSARNDLNAVGRNGKSWILNRFH
jgi:hypothetical protein